MPNFAIRERASLLIGSPWTPGTGQNGGQLTSAVKDCPDAVILLDEIEKVDPAVWDPCLRLFDEGVLNDPGLEHDVDFANTIIFLTSNLLQGLDPATPEDEVRRKLLETEHFRPELVNRIDRIVLFRPLEPSVVRQIIRKVIVRIVAQFQAQQGFRQFVVEVDGALLDHILSRCDPQFGARDIQRQVELVVGKALADAFPGAGTAWRQAESLWLGTEEGIVIAKFE